MAESDASSTPARRWFLVIGWSLVTIVLVAVLTMPLIPLGACTTEVDCGAASVVGIPTSWALWGVITVLALIALWIGLAMRGRRAK